MAAGASITHFDTALARTLQVQASTTLLHWATLPTWAGDPPVVIALVAAVGAWLLWRRERLLALAWVAAVVGNALLNKGLKHLFERADLPPLTVPTDWRSPGLKVNRSFVSAHCQQHRQRAGGAAGRIVPAGRVPDCCAA